MIKLSGLAGELHDETCEMRIVDCHEHLLTEAARPVSSV